MVCFSLPGNQEKGVAQDADTEELAITDLPVACAYSFYHTGSIADVRFAKRFSLILATLLATLASSVF